MRSRMFGSQPSAASLSCTSILATMFAQASRTCDKPKSSRLSLSWLKLGEVTSRTQGLEVLPNAKKSFRPILTLEELEVVEAQPRKAGPKVRRPALEAVYKPGPEDHPKSQKQLQPSLIIPVRLGATMVLLVAKITTDKRMTRRSATSVASTTRTSMRNRLTSITGNSVPCSRHAGSVSKSSRFHRSTNI